MDNPKKYDEKEIYEMMGETLDFTKNEKEVFRKKYDGTYSTFVSVVGFESEKCSRFVVPFFFMKKDSNFTFHNKKMNEGYCKEVLEFYSLERCAVRKDGESFIVFDNCLSKIDKLVKIMSILKLKDFEEKNSKYYKEFLQNPLLKFDKKNLVLPNSNLSDFYCPEWKDFKCIKFSLNKIDELKEYEFNYIIPWFFSLKSTCETMKTIYKNLYKTENRIPSFLLVGFVPNSFMLLFFENTRSFFSIVGRSGIIKSEKVGE